MWRDCGHWRTGEFGGFHALSQQTFAHAYQHAPAELLAWVRNEGARAGIRWLFDFSLYVAHSQRVADAEARARAMSSEDEEDRKVAQAFDAYNERRYEEHLEEKEQEEKEEREREDEAERSSDDSDYVYDTDEETEGWTSEEEDYPEIEDFRAVEARGERDGLEPYDKDSLYNFRRYHVRQMMHHVRAFDEGRTIHRTFCDLWFKTHARLQSFLPRDLTNKEGKPDDPWVITKGELELLVRLGTPAASGMADEGFECDMDGWEEAVAYAPEELPDRIDVDFKAPECVWPKNYCHGNWNGL